MEIPYDLIQKLVIILAIIILTTLVGRLITKGLNHMKRFKEDITGIYLIRDIIISII